MQAIATNPAGQTVPECEVCFEPYGWEDPARRPRRLDCAPQHVLCQACVDTLWRDDGSSGFLCPFCRVHNNIRGFPVAHGRPGSGHRSPPSPGRMEIVFLGPFWVRAKNV